MAKVSVSIKTDIPKFIRGFFEGVGGTKFQDNLETAIKEEVTGSMSRGNSPVRGYGRFKAYKRPEKYPSRTGEARGYPKRVRPVNLFLSGALYRSLASKMDGGKFIFGTLRAKDPVDIYASVHNEGERSDIAQRKFLPTATGEEFTLRIMDRLKEMFAKRLKELLDFSSK